MLGMMNCPTSDTFDFYSSSPRAIRQMAPEKLDMAKNDQKQKEIFPIVPNDDANLFPSDAFHQQRTSNNPYQVFWGLNQRPKITYTEDGRRMIDGKLAKEFEKPAENLWGRVIVDSVTKNKLCHKRSNSLNEKCSAEEEEEEQNADSEIEGGDGKRKRRFSFGSILPMKKKTNANAQEKKKLGV